MKTNNVLELLKSKGLGEDEKKLTSSPTSSLPTEPILKKKRLYQGIQNDQPIDSQPRTNLGQTSDKPRTQPRTQPRTNLGQTSDKPRTNDLQNLETSDKPRTQPRTQPRTNLGQTSDKPRTIFDFESMFGLKRKILIFIFDMTKSTRSEITPAIAVELIAESCQTTKLSTQKTIQRLENHGLIKRIDFRNGRGGWTKYSLEESLYKKMLTLETQDKLRTNLGQTSDKLRTEPRTQPRTNPSSSSSYIYINNKTTTTSEDEKNFETWEMLCERFGLIEKRINANDLNKIWQKGSFDTLERFRDSIEHIAFYLNSPEAAGIQNPKAWFIYTLLKGYFSPPVGFKSWEELQLDAQLAAAQEKNRILEEKRRKLLEAKFQIWLHELSQERRKEILSSTLFFGEKADSVGARAMLRDAFMKEEIGEPPTIE